MNLLSQLFINLSIIYKTVYLDDPSTCVGVHCVTGLGRAPVLVAVALIELGMKYEVNKFINIPLHL